MATVCSGWHRAGLGRGSWTQESLKGSCGPTILCDLASHAGTMPQVSRLQHKDLPSLLVTAYAAHCLNVGQ